MEVDETDEIKVMMNKSKIRQENIIKQGENT